ncbi:hypothetical protein N8654_03135 [Synechococcus sp. AH-601-B19]|nr:hypothetical protein [Synechococcus sp. AH-601-B19]
MGDQKIGVAAELIATCIQTKVWETIAIYDDDNPEIKTYQPMEWCREVLKQEPGELMKIVASPLPRPEVGAAAAIELIRMLKEFEPESFAILSRPNIQDNWQDLLKTNERRDPKVWAKVVFELEDHISRRPSNRHGGGRPLADPELVQRAQSLYSEHKSLAKVSEIMEISKPTIQRWVKLNLEDHRINWTEDTSTQKRRSGDTREGIRNKLEKYMCDPELRKQNGVSEENVEKALASMLTGGSGYGALRIAGIAPAKKPEIRLRCKQDKSTVAARIIELLKPEEAFELVEEIARQLKSLKDATPNPQ